MEVCKVCRNTGMRPLSNDLDCTDCNSAVERAAFNKWRENELNSIGTENDDWAIHQRALAMAPKQKAPAGWKLVPEEPTSNMFRAANKIDNEMFAGGSSHGAEDEQVWTAMYHAAPEAPCASPAAANGAEDIKDMAQARRVITQLRAATGQDAALVALIHKAQIILAHHLPPDGPDAKTTISALLGLLDGPESRAALSGAKGN